MIEFSRNEIHRDRATSELVSESLLARKFLQQAWNGLYLMTLREKGERATLDLEMIQLRDHQDGHLMDGLKKLGIDGDPPAVAAAKYHYLSNGLAGLNLEYIEETPKKAWIRYLGPHGAGLGMLAHSGAFRRNTFSWWHRRNGKLMGCPTLGWVSTKFIMDGDPYDEGYFIEYDHEVDFDAPLKIEIVDHTPEFDPSRAPQLNPMDWPMERQLKARRKFYASYLFSAFQALTKLYGLPTSSQLLEATMRCVAVQNTRDLARLAGIDDSGIPAVKSLVTALLRACGQHHEIVHDGAEEFAIRVAPLRAFEGVTSDSVHAALFSFYETAVRIIDGHISASRVPDPNDTSTIWCFENKGKWLW
ncbi:hypothetical protein [Nocardia sp. NPDC059239]|uniref:hypothetical protein n=1 Tax=Nocardia sp. NPDC059239 TaxID=3346785 RepID=UPI00368D3E56